jgi:hypothetical protein
VSRSRSNRRALLVLLAVLGVGCSGQPDLATGGTTEFGRSTTPAPDAVNVPRAVHVAVEVRTETEPEVADASIEIDPDELRASWEADRLADAGGTVDADRLTGQLVHRHRAVVISWDEPEFADANAFFLEVDGRHVQAFDTNDEFGIHGSEPVSRPMEFVITRGELRRAGPEAQWALRLGWAPYGWYANEAREASVVLSDPVELDLPELGE